MKKNILLLLTASILVVSLAGCGGSKKIVHCDNCGADIEVDASSNVDDSWTLLCAKCEEELGIDAALAESFK